MASKPAIQNPVMPANLQRAFESAVRDIYETGLTGKPSRYRTPIGKQFSSESKFNAEKRALSDAAKALAELWKVSPHSSR